MARRRLDIRPVGRVARRMPIGQSRLALGSTRAFEGLSISAQCCRVPVAVGHYETVWVRLRDAATLAEMEKALAAGSLWIDVFTGSAGD